MEKGERMTINFDKIIEIYGDELLITILENVKDVESNINYLNSLGYTCKTPA